MMIAAVMTIAVVDEFVMLTVVLALVVLVSLFVLLGALMEIVPLSLSFDRGLLVLVVVDLLRSGLSGAEQAEHHQGEDAGQKWFRDGEHGHFLPPMVWRRCVCRCDRIA